MKKLLFILPLIIFFSCSVQKRHYQKGFYVSNVKQQKRTLNQVSVTRTKEIKSDKLILKPNNLQTFSNETADLTASVDIKTMSVKKFQLPLLTKGNDSLCDIIILKNGDEVKVKVLEISPIEIKYKKCNLPDGPLYVVKKSDVFMVKYANGTKEIIKSETEPVSSNANKSSANNKVKTTHESAIFALVAGICGIFIGIGSIPAIILGDIALKKIKAEPDKYEGADLAMIGKVLGIIGLVLKILLLILLFAIIFSI